MSGRFLCASALVWAGVLGVLAPQSAAAQLRPEAETGTRIKTKPTSVDPGMAVAMRKALGRCIVSRRRDIVDAVLKNSDPATVDWKAAGVDRDRFYNKEWVKECGYEFLNLDQAKASIALPDLSFRALLLEAAYLNDIGSVPTLDEAGSDAPPRHYVSPSEQLGVAQGNAAFADCVIRKDAASADALLRALPGSQWERDIAQKLAPTFGQCVPQGQTLKLTFASMRAIAADGLWTRFVAQPQYATARAK